MGVIRTAAPKRERPALNDKELAWEGTFVLVLRKMSSRLTGELDQAQRLELVNTAAQVAAQLVAGSAY